MRRLERSKLRFKKRRKLLTKMRSMLKRKR
jgi:hypothetical protein